MRSIELVGWFCHDDRQPLHRPLRVGSRRVTHTHTHRPHPQLVFPQGWSIGTVFPLRSRRPTNRHRYRASRRTVQMAITAARDAAHRTTKKRQARAA